MYDPQIGKWNAIDPVSEKYPSWSPYNYCLNNPIIISDINGEDGVIVITGIIVGNAINLGLNGSGRGNYNLYSVHIYNDMTRSYYEKATKNSSIIPDATVMVARDAWLSDKKAIKPRSEKRFGDNNEVPLGWHYLEYDPNKVSKTKDHYLKITDERGADYVVGPDGERTGLHWHNYSPWFSWGCPTSGKDNGNLFWLDELLELMPELKNPIETVHILFEDRLVYYNYSEKTWKGTTEAELEFWENLKKQMAELLRLRE